MAGIIKLLPKQHLPFQDRMNSSIPDEDIKTAVGDMYRILDHPNSIRQVMEKELSLIPT